ncbi:MAG: ABC transporter transmembrane domain-containing protein [Victivallaceae bacterium]|nr:ABC transporter transmembrane domain-containing protein [Victivallaceae bacterium]
MEQVQYPTGIVCLNSLMNNLRRNVNFDALITEQVRQGYAENSGETLLKLAEQLELSPLLVNKDKDEFDYYHGPALLKMKNGNWVCMVDYAALVARKNVTIFDPSIQGPQKIGSCNCEQVDEKWCGEALLFLNLQPIDTSRNTALFCFTSIAKHHNLSLDMRQLMHEYAVGEEEPSERLMLKMASDHELKAKHASLPWEKLAKIGRAYPLMARKKNGRWVVLCGFRPNDENGRNLVVVDPETRPETSGQRFLFWSEADYEEQCSGTGIYLKRIYKLTDENQPFGLLWFLPEFMKLKGVFAQIAMAVLAITAVALVIPLFFQIVVDKVLANSTYNTLNVLFIGVCCALVFNAGMEYLRSYLLLFATNKIDINTATKTFRHLMRLPVDFFERVPSGVLLKHMQQTERIRGFLSGNLFFTFLEVTTLVVFVPFLLLYSVRLTMVVVAFSLMMAVVIGLLIRPFQRRLHELYNAEGKRQSMLVEAIHGIKTVKSLAVEPVQEKAWNDSTAYAINAYFKVGKISMTAKTLSQFLETMMTVTVIYMGTLMVFDLQLMVGELIAFQMLSGRVTGPLVKMVALVHEYQQVALSVKMLGVVMNTAPEPAGGGVRNPLKGNVSFENVNFQYTPDTPLVIKNFSLELKSGQSLGIVGRSGSGKTTLTKLLQGLYPIQGGLIKIDGIDIREIDKTHLRSSIGVVLQENYFFNGTVRDNICLTKRSATLEEIIYASKLAGADEFVQKLTKGYDTMLEENASNLSGGQKQRLAIARALLTNPAILIFDEATSALDPESENVIQTNLNAMARGRTLIIVSHRLSIVSGCNNILVIESGERKAMAPHRELVTQPGTYREFWQQQLGRHIVEDKPAAPAAPAAQRIDARNITIANGGK